MPTSGIVHSKLLTIANAEELDSWCEIAGGECCVDTGICGTNWPDSLFITFAGLDTPQLGYFTDFDNIGGVDYQLADMSAMQNKSYRMRLAGTGTVDPTETPPPLVYILANSVAVGGGTSSHVEGEQGGFGGGPYSDTLTPHINLSPASGELVTGTTGSVFHPDITTPTTTTPARPILLAPTQHTFTIPCDAECIRSQVAGPVLIWGVPGDLADCTDGSFSGDHVVLTTGNCRACHGSGGANSPFSTPNPGTTLGWATATYQSTGPRIRMRVFEQCIMLVHCIEDEPSIEIYFETWLVVYEQGKWNWIVDVGGGFTDVGFMTHNRVTAHRYPNYGVIASFGGAVPLVGTLPYVSFVDTGIAAVSLSQ